MRTPPLPNVVPPELRDPLDEIRSKFLPDTQRDGERIEVHFVTSGFTALGRVFMRGDELSVTVGSTEWFESLDPKDGRSWIDQDEDAQEARYGQVYLRPGPAPQGMVPEEAEEFTADRRRIVRSRTVATIRGEVD